MQEEIGVGNDKSPVMTTAIAEGSVPEGTGLKLRREGANTMSCCRREEADVSLSLWGSYPCNLVCAAGL